MENISYSRHRFPPFIIQHAVWLYFRFSLSYRDVEDLLAERGIDVSYETIRRWVQKFGRQYAKRLCHVNPLRKDSGGRVLAGYAEIAAAHELTAADRNCFIVDLDRRCRWMLKWL
jgi:hypothetical protein